ncbi:unnamed protein product [Rotaria sordida]|uniref:Uncharacterized protein n=1 Tax=Rotaria sordida TaxID=392033 RepID=A0A815JYJ9_9BILA|nr:unnamed protein product [Rotaria sordida]
MNIKKLFLFVIIGVTVASEVKVRVKNKCWWPLKVHIGNGDNGRWIDAGGDSWGTNGRSDRTWAEQPGIWGDNTLAEINDDNGRICTTNEDIFSSGSLRLHSYYAHA